MTTILILIGYYVIGAALCALKYWDLKRKTRFNTWRKLREWFPFVPFLVIAWPLVLLLRVFVKLDFWFWEA